MSGGRQKSVVLILARELASNVATPMLVIDDVGTIVDFDDEYLSHVGWGHSAVSHTVALARRADAKQVVLFHHDPAHSDADLERLLAIARDLWQDAPSSPVLAYEGMEIVLDATRSV